MCAVLVRGKEEEVEGRTGVSGGESESVPLCVCVRARLSQRPAHAFRGV